MLLSLALGALMAGLFGLCFAFLAFSQKVTSPRSERL